VLAFLNRSATFMVGRQGEFRQVVQPSKEVALRACNAYPKDVIADPVLQNIAFQERNGARPIPGGGCDVLAVSSSLSKYCLSSDLWTRLPYPVVFSYLNNLMKALWTASV
jgi:hypothetical protein